MPCWFEVFDNEDVQLATRRSVMAVGVFMTVGVVVTLAVVAASEMVRMPTAGVFATLSITWALMVFVSATRLRRLRRIAWCLKLTNEQATAYNYARRKTVIPWTAVTRIDWSRRGLTISGEPPCTIEIPERFTEFEILSHLVYDFAEELNIPIHVDGMPLSVLDVRRLYPFLAELDIVPDERDSGGLATH